MNSAFLILVTERKQMQLLLNAGGPDRVSRVQMAEAVAQFRGHETSLIKSVSASTVSIVLHFITICDMESVPCFLCLSALSSSMYEIINL